MLRTRPMFLVCALAGTIAAQEVTIRTVVPLVIAPTSVTGRDGKFVDGLTESDFVLYDNSSERTIRMDAPFVPISLAVVVQTSGLATPALAKVRRIGSMIEPLVIGERGDATVMTYDNSVRVRQEFTTNPLSISKAVNEVRSGGEGSCMIDAVAEAVQSLGARPPNRRRVVLVIGENKDRSSKRKLEDVVTLAQQQNITIYSVTYSAFVSAFSSKQPAPGSAGLNLIAIFREISRLAATNTAEALTRYTGGLHLSFVKQRALEQAISAIAEELHSQYLLSFQPPPQAPSEYHQLEVRIRNRPELKVRTRPGYWVAGS